MTRLSVIAIAATLAASAAIAESPVSEHKDKWDALRERDRPSERDARADGEAEERTSAEARAVPERDEDEEAE